MQVKQMINRKFPGVEVVGSNYPPSATSVALGKLASFGTMGGIAVSLFGDKIFAALSMETPDLAKAMMDNKFGSCMGAWFIGNRSCLRMLIKHWEAATVSGEKN